MDQSTRPGEKRRNLRQSTSEPPVKSPGTMDGFSCDFSRISITSMEEPISEGSYQNNVTVNGVHLQPEELPGFMAPYTPLRNVYDFSDNNNQSEFTQQAVQVQQQHQSEPMNYIKCNECPQQENSTLPRRHAVPKYRKKRRDSQCLMDCYKTAKEERRRKVSCKEITLEFLRRKSSGGGNQKPEIRSVSPFDDSISEQHESPHIISPLMFRFLEDTDIAKQVDSGKIPPLKSMQGRRGRKTGIVAPPPQWLNEKVHQDNADSSDTSSVNLSLGENIHYPSPSHSNVSDSVLLGLDQNQGPRISTGSFPGEPTIPAFNRPLSPSARCFSMEGYNGAEMREQKQDTQILLFDSTPDLTIDNPRFPSMRNCRRGAICYDYIDTLTWREPPRQAAGSSISSTSETPY
ncbi:unnamed protein product [Owenia fusiformis]|uniref:Uncharacterized protein n=1 Tax=Owenia fusiformis TaxID=6347 RepID=A0A8J1UXH6_OWEFU|nr:unnamed protein product [Owenia fusiformis]